MAEGKRTFADIRRLVKEEPAQGRERTDRVWHGRKLPVRESRWPIWQGHRDERLFLCRYL